MRRGKLWKILSCRNHLDRVKLVFRKSLRYKSYYLH